MVAVGGGAKRKIFSSPTSSAVVIPKRLLKEQKPKKSLEKREEKKKKAHVMREWIFQRRRRSSDQHRMVRENAVTEGEFYFRFIRMSPCRFEHLLSLVGPKLMQKRTSIQDLMADADEFSSLADRFFLERMSPAERLTLTLRYLATGEGQDSLSLSLGISETVIRDIVSDTCVNLWDVLSSGYVQPPRSDEDWIEISDQFYVLTGIVHCLGAVDAKQIMLESTNLPTPGGGPSPYQNYDHFFNLLLISSCDAHYCFNLVDIGSHVADADDVLDNSEMGTRFEAGKMNVPAPEELAGCSMSKLPYFLVGDSAFPLKHWLMKPYPGSISRSQKIFNCRIARAQRFIENSNGVLAARWRVYRAPLRASVEEAQKISLATVGLHNYLMMTETPSYCPRGFVDSADANGGLARGMWRDVIDQDQGRCALQPVPQSSLVSRIDAFAMGQREALSSFFMQEEAANFKREQTEIERFRSRTVFEDSSMRRQFEMC